ncbi:Ferric/cupric reductase transmembrane component B [Fusarium oxysporum f. sp. rapae]|uniref:Ferric/cupric reductase transmembrane component B n=1 Tax=Fusarium oxysporum f. sp. rapae TaxID=485398 RepID=A0A8J5U0I8_FUSOX|nr:Ferric/cupric reductase transmembrane component B [Fusarium oxysporum f. sp. rapae]
MAQSKRVALSALLTLCAIGVQADGTGLIGWGKTMYNPTCSFACRQVIRKQQLSCTPTESTENHGTAHNPVTTPPDCFVEDHVFLKTMALCIDTYCPLAGNPSMSLIKDYWASHLGTGTIGKYDYIPVMSYEDALSAAREDESMASHNTNSTSGHKSGSHHKKRTALFPRHGGHDKSSHEGLITFNVSSPLPVTAGGTEPLNETSFIGPEDWQLQYNYLYDFETNEAGHTTMTITITLVAIFLPVVLSLLRFIPGLTKSRGWAYWQSFLVVPAAFGKRHREPTVAGNVPNSGQALYIALISILNILLWLGPYTVHQPQASFASLKMQTISVVGNRAGDMAMGNVVALFLFSTRNNILLYVTDWSHSTYLLLHRWLGYWAIFHTVVHSAMLLANYVIQGTYEEELVREYWIWGIVGTVAVCAILPCSLQPVRQKMYEFFLGSHIILALLFIIGYYYHIWYLYEYNWGYEIFAFVAGGIWGLEHVVRLVRMAWQGNRKATISTISDVGGEYIRIEIDGKPLEGGVAYLAFPTLSWRFWETHPFSVAYSGSLTSENSHQPSTTGAKEESVTVSPSSETDAEKAVNINQNTSVVSANEGRSTVFYARVRTGMTKKLASRVSGQQSEALQLRVIVEGPCHHSGHISPQLSHCKDILCIAGGVGITACLPYLRQGAPGNTKLFWSSRKKGLVTALTPALADLPRSVQAETVVGERLDLRGILTQELIGAPDDGALAIVMCGPPGMADEVRRDIVEIVRSNALCRAYVLLDEAFSW